MGQAIQRQSASERDSMAEHKKRVVIQKGRKDQIQPVLNSLFNLLYKHVDSHDLAIEVSKAEELRNNDQNAKGWAMWTDISNQVEWYGQKLAPEDWKDLLSHDWKNQQIVPGISGGFCAIGGVRTSKLSKREFASLIEISYAFGSQKGVKWSDESMGYYELLSKKNER